MKKSIIIGSAVALLALVALFTFAPSEQENPNQTLPSPGPGGSSFAKKISTGRRAFLARMFGTPENNLQASGQHKNRNERDLITLSERSPLLEAQNRRKMRAEIIEDLKHLAKYPDDSNPIFGGNDALINEYTVSPATARSDKEEDPPYSLKTWVSKNTYVFPDAPVIYATISDPNGKPVSGHLEVAIYRDDDKNQMKLSLLDNGQGVDVAAGDGIYSGVLEFASTQETQLAGRYIAVTQASQFSNKMEIRSATGFLWTAPGGVLTGRYRDKSDGTYLTIEAEVKITKAGYFHLQGSVYGQNNKALAWAQAASELQPGTHWIALNYYGYIFREVNAKGPYSLKYVTLSRTGIIPPMKGRLIENAYQTSSYDPSSFTDKPYNNENYLNQLANMEKEQREEEEAISKAKKN